MTTPDQGSNTIPHNSIVNGDCINVMQQLPPNSVDFILTDPPYLVNYKSRDGRGVPNDDNARWLRPAAAQMFRVLKPDSFCISFYGFPAASRFQSAFRDAGFRIVGNLVFAKRYSSSARYVERRHECAYLLVKGNPPLPAQPIPDLIYFNYTGNKLHPTQKPVSALMPLISAFCPQDGLVLDPFAGSGSTLLGAKVTGRRYIGIKLSAEYHGIAQRRLAYHGQRDQIPAAQAASQVFPRHYGAPCDEFPQPAYA